jgi:hypothetical protein
MDALLGPSVNPSRLAAWLLSREQVEEETVFAGD